MFKIRSFLGQGLRLRTACDLDVQRVTVTRPQGFDLPSLADIERQLPHQIEAVAVKGLFGDSPVHTVKYEK